MIKIGCDHLICKKCKRGFDLEDGDVFWVGYFIKEHWHKRQKLHGSYFEVAFADFPEHLTIMHNMPSEYISVTEPDNKLSFKKQTQNTIKRKGNERSM